MIWHRDQIIPDDALQISVLDRTFEHGLGLFETFRTWNGRPTLLGRHIERMRRSACELNLPLEPSQLPDHQAVLELISANRVFVPPGQDVRLRLTLSGGRSAAPFADSILWMTAGPLPPPVHGEGAVITHTMLVSPDDILAKHKTLNYWRKRMAHDHAVANGSDEVICLTSAGLICETSLANIFLIHGRRVSTPATDGPLLPGVMRSVILERAEQIGLDVVAGPIPRERIATADEAFLTNSVRGMLPVARLLDRELPSPGPTTRQIWSEVLPWLVSGGIAS